jgi:hypothetical protein
MKFFSVFVQFASTSDRNFWSLRQFVQGQPYTHFPSFSPLFNLLKRHALRPQGSVGFYFVFVQFVQGSGTNFLRNP